MAYPLVNQLPENGSQGILSFVSIVAVPVKRKVAQVGAAMSIEAYILIGTGFFTAIAAISTYLSVTRGAQWAARDLDKMDPIKQRLAAFMPHINNKTHAGGLLLHTGEYIHIQTIESLEFGIVRLSGSIDDSITTMISFDAPMKIKKVSSNIAVRYNAVAVFNVDEYPKLDDGKDTGLAAQ